MNLHFQSKRFRRWSVAATAAALAGLLFAATTGGSPGGSGGSSDDDETREPAVATASSISFTRDILPIFTSNCFKCHGPDVAARQVGLRLDTRIGATATLNSGNRAIVPDQPHDSALLYRVTTEDESERMPPADEGDRLSDTEIDLLRQWIESGAPYDLHWAYRRPAKPTIPNVRDEQWPRNPIDRFVLAPLEAEDISPSPEADRYALVRRVSLDLIGLPPATDAVEAYINDQRPGAYERMVDRILESPHFGERWASVWLDAARYSDTKGYEADRRRTMWPYRDWVIRAINDDMPFTQFTIEQLAGDLLPDPTIDQMVATAFHRNTMTNDEGGTDNEEFRAAAVIDRVNTTMQTWMGMTIACAQCHSHKYDPIDHRDYYEFYAFFNQTQDNDEMDERPVMAVSSEDQRRELEAFSQERKQIQEHIATLTASIDLESTTRDVDPAIFEPVDQHRDLIWIDDDVPAGAISDTPGGVEAWTWRGSDETPIPLGERSLVVNAGGDVFRQVFFTQADRCLDVGVDDVLIAHVRLDPDNPPREIMLQWHTLQKGWEQRAYWGENLIQFGADESPARLSQGALPAVGEWVKLEIPAVDVGLEPEIVIDGWAFSQFGGVVSWDAAGIHTRAPDAQRYQYDQDVWEERAVSKRAPPPPADILKVIRVDREKRTDEQREALHEYYLRRVFVSARSIFAESNAQLADVDSRTKAVQGQIPRVPVMRELLGETRRTTRIFRRGSFLSPEDEVTADVPDILHDMQQDWPRNRLGLAYWLVDDANPLTARVQVNRAWEQLFGTGLVETSEDFGVQGIPPSHPDLLDWLAIEHEELGWSLKALCRLIVTSATYRQSSRMTREQYERDPGNRWLGRGARFRLPAEMIRDQALAVSGLLGEQMFGPPVYPPQPEGVWQIIYNADRWTASGGDDRHRRAIYTFWRRTSPYPSMITFDSPSHEFCISRRIRTNTPLQALVTMNDPVYIEAARALANALREDADDDVPARLSRAIHACLIRPPRPGEIERLAALYESELAHYRDHADEARKLILAADDDTIDDAAAAERAAWTVVCNVLLNLDEFLTRQ